MPELTALSRRLPLLVPPLEQNPSLHGWMTITCQFQLRSILSPNLHAHYAQYHVIGRATSVAALSCGRDVTCLFVCPSGSCTAFKRLDG